MTRLLIILALMAALFASLYNLSPKFKGGVDRLYADYKESRKPIQCVMYQPQPTSN